MEPRCPIILHFADQDSFIPMDTVEAFKARHPELTVHIYHSDHGFNCDHRGSYHADSARLARERTLQLFRQHLG